MLNLSASVYWNRHRRRHLLHADRLLHGSDAAADVAASSADRDLDRAGAAESARLLPAHYTYLNFGEVRDKGMWNWRRRRR
jgi:hypothetical protein